MSDQRNHGDTARPEAGDQTAGPESPQPERRPAGPADPNMHSGETRAAADAGEDKGKSQDQREAQKVLEEADKAIVSEDEEVERNGERLPVPPSRVARVLR